MFWNRLATIHAPRAVRAVRTLHLTSAAPKKDTTAFRRWRDRKKKGEQIRLRELVKEAELDVVGRSASAAASTSAAGGKKKPADGRK